MASSGSMEIVDAALRDVRLGLEVDGYLLHVESTDEGTLRARVEATQGACEECLVDKDIMAAIVADALPASLGIGSVVLRYPHE